MVGTDIIEVSRIEKLITEKGRKFLNRIYTQNEIDYCESKGPNKYQHYAGRFAAKEAVFKVIQSNDTHKSLKFKDIQILNKDDGSPYANIVSSSGGASLVLLNRTISSRIYISISHIKEYATAIAFKK